MNTKSTIYIWGKKSFPDIEHYAFTYQLPVYRVEDGFIRSVGLGSDLTQPYSLVVDSRGIYFDPSCESDLEDILQNHQFSTAEIERAKSIKIYLIEKKLSKYNLYSNIDLELPKNKKIILVPGQVEDDASILFGARGMTNFELLKQTRSKHPEAYIVYKPHPDVLVGNRIGKIEDSEAMRYCDQIATEVGIDSVLAYTNEVHTMTSLVGFEALIRGIKVVTYGTPFYAGWGLTEDQKCCERRTRKLSIEELVAGSYILYPIYIHPYTQFRCEVEEVLEILDRKRKQYRSSFWIQCRNYLCRKSQITILPQCYNITRHRIDKNT